MTLHPTHAPALNAGRAAAGHDADPACTVRRLRATFDTGRTRPLRWRRSQLEALQRLLAEREQEFIAALDEDLGRSATETWLADLAPVATEAAYASKRLRWWMRSRRAGVPLSARPGRAWIVPEPLGVALIIGPWNYPVFLTLSPLVGALAAGNCAIVKPSEHTPAVSAALKRLLPLYLDPDAITVLEGGAETTQALIDQGLDHVFFTGGPEVGKAVMTAAAKHLTPVTLELGGKSPVIIAADANVAVAARRVAFTKLLNSGQTCVAPDYVLVDAQVRDEFVRQLTAAVVAFTADRDLALPLVNTRHAQRIQQLLSSAGGSVVLGGGVDAENRRAQLTVIVDPDPASALMTEEIFGPLLPVVTVESVDAAITHVRRGPKPLAVYLFSSRRSVHRRVLAEISNGATVINHLMFQVLVPQLPFGGVGTSGMGTYHGKWGFDTFSHRKSVLRKPSWPDPDLLYPPYSAVKTWLLRRVF